MDAVNQRQRELANSVMDHVSAERAADPSISAGDLFVVFRLLFDRVEAAWDEALEAEIDGETTGEEGGL